MQVTVPATFSGTFTGTLTIDVPDQPGQQPPLGFWGGYRPPYVDIGFPGPQPPPGQPTHPIAPGGPPLGFWGGRPPPYVDIGFPGPQPQPPLGFWGGLPPLYVDIGGPGPQPQPPGTQPPDPGVPGPGGNFNWQFKPAWDPMSGWRTVVVGTPAPGADQPIVTPSEETTPTP